MPHTPWVWVPKELTATEEASKSAYGSSNPGAQGNQAQSQQSEKALPAPPYTTSSRDHSRAPSSSQRDAFPNPQFASSHARPLHQAPGPALSTSAPAAVSSYSSYHRQQQQSQPQQTQRPPDTQRPAERYAATSQQPQQDNSAHARQHSHEASVRPSAEPQSHRDYRSASASASSSASAAAAARERERERTSSGDREQREPHRNGEAYSESREMHLTFSPKIVRTPGHYSSGSRHSGHEENDLPPARTPPLGSIYAPAGNAPSRSNSMSARRQSSMPPSVNTSVSTTPSSSLGLLTFTEEPQALLSPLVVGSTPPMETRPSPGRDIPRDSGRDVRDVGRSQTYPVIERPGYDVAFSGDSSEREGKSYPRTPRPRESSRQRLSADHEYERAGDRDRSANVTPQPSARTPPMRTPPTRTPPSRTSPSSYNTRPSPEGGAYHARQISRSHTYPSVTPVIPPPVIPPPVIPSPPSTSPRYGSSSQHHSSSTSHQHQSDRKSTRLNSSHSGESRMPSSA